MTSIEESQNITTSTLKGTKCIACKEFIQPSAAICPKCRSLQQPVKWARLGKFLKIVAGFTAVLSLIIVATEVTNLASHDRNIRKKAIDMVGAARLLWDAKDESSALSLLDRAEVIYPNLREARTLRADIGIASISMVYPLSTVNAGLEELLIKPDETGIPEYIYLSTIKRKNIESLLENLDFPETLAIIAAESTGTEKARALAYLAWVELILNPGINVPGVNIDTDIDLIFNKALDASEDDAIVNLFRATWLASSPLYQGTIKETERLEQSKISFNKALAECGDSDIIINNLSLRRWIRAVQLNTLPPIEGLGVVRDMLVNHEPLAKNTFSLTRRLFISLSGTGGAPYPEKVKNTEAELVSRYKPAELVEVATELASVHYGCTQDGNCADRSDRESGQMLYAVGRMYELGGNTIKAHEYYQKATSHAGLAGWWESTFTTALERTEP